MTNDWRGLELYSPANLEHSKKIADMLWQSGAYCKPWIKNPSTILVIMQRGASLGFDPLTALDELFQFAQGGAWGIRIGAMLVLTNSLNLWLKVAFALPRPYWIDARVKGIVDETTFGMPSGHAMGAASLWGLTANL